MNYIETCMDESGFTGYDLLNKEQNFQSLSCVTISESEAKRVIDECFPRRQFQELKYSQLSRRRSHWPRLLELQRILLKDHDGVSFIVHKAYALVLKMIDICIEPYYYSLGVDFYANGQNLALASLVHHTGPAFFGLHIYESFLVTFQKMLKTKASDDVRAFFEAFKQLPECDLKDELYPLSQPSSEVIRSIYDARITTDISDSIIIGLVSWLEQRASASYKIIHDNSGNFESYKRALSRLILIKSHEAFKISEANNISFPLKLKQIEESNSLDKLGIQLADILAGGIIDAAQALSTAEQGNEYSEKIIALYGLENIIFLMPSLDFSETARDFSDNQSSRLIDFLSLDPE